MHSVRRKTDTPASDRPIQVAKRTKRSLLISVSKNAFKIHPNRSTYIERRAEGHNELITGAGGSERGRLKLLASWQMHLKCIPTSPSAVPAVPAAAPAARAVSAA